VLASSVRVHLRLCYLMTRRLNLPLNLMIIPSQSNDSSPQSDNCYPALESRVSTRCPTQPNCSTLVQFIAQLNCSISESCSLRVRLRNRLRCPTRFDSLFDSACRLWPMLASSVRLNSTSTSLFCDFRIAPLIPNNGLTHLLSDASAGRLRRLDSAVRCPNSA
jgi:hypothetical protein